MTHESLESTQFCSELMSEYSDLETKAQISYLRQLSAVMTFISHFSATSV